MALSTTYSQLIKHYFIGVKIPSFFYVALFFALGIIGQCYCSIPIFINALLLSSCLGALCIVPSRYKKLFLIALIPLSLGGILYQKQQYNHTRFYALTNHASFDIIATITSIEKPIHSHIKQQIIVRATKIKIHQPNADWTACDEKIHFYVMSKAPLEVGDYVEIDKIKTSQNKNQSYETYLIKEGIALTVFLSNVNYTILNHPTHSFNRWLFTIKKNLVASLKNKMSPEAFAMVACMFLGYKNIDKKYIETFKEQCKVWGVYHYLARAGLHLVIFIFIWNAICALFPIAFMARQFFITLLIFLYYLLSWPSLPFMRAFSTFIVCKACTVQKLPVHYIHVLSVITFLTLLLNPMHLFFLDFQLSFGVTFAIAWFNLINYSKKQAA